eukprot:gnl/MRDRNA2_/MRDRNA2_112650_c0_seq1.p1 gnl/MRDRNA2_/MRDRNA2_112650_c0~~gnl/MRDRNA2_/MRDRNA2_112650_c0_seq1.p1  ORF type:complete len:396 (+),score=94.83 gnl/MRDRNA2_/MRDRNA2_112650_c0_seq1:58-1188(+)
MGPPPNGWQVGDPWPQAVLQQSGFPPPVGWRPGMDWPPECGAPPDGWQAGDPWPQIGSRAQTPMAPPAGWRPGMSWPAELGPPPQGWQIGDPWPQGGAAQAGAFGQAPPPPGWHPGMDWPSELGLPPPGWKIGDPWPQGGGMMPQGGGEKFSTKYHMYRRLAPPVPVGLQDDGPGVGFGGDVSGGPAGPFVDSSLGDAHGLPEVASSIGGRAPSSSSRIRPVSTPADISVQKEQRHWAPLPVRWHNPDGMFSKYKHVGGHLRGAPIARGGGWQYLTSSQGRRGANGSRELMESTSASQSLESGTEDVGINSEITYENQMLRRQVAQLEKELKQRTDYRKQVSELEKKLHQTVGRPSRGMRRGWPMAQSSGALMDGI